MAHSGKKIQNEFKEQALNQKLITTEQIKKLSDETQEILFTTQGIKALQSGLIPAEAIIELEERCEGRVVKEENEKSTLSDLFDLTKTRSSAPEFIQLLISPAGLRLLEKNNEAKKSVLHHSIDRETNLLTHLIYLDKSNWPAKLHTLQQMVKEEENQSKSAFRPFRRNP